MTLHILNYNNGQDYSDNCDKVLGVFDSAEKLEEAKKKCTAREDLRYPVDPGIFYQWTCELNEILE